MEQACSQRVQGVKDSSEMLKNYKEWFCLRIGNTKKRHSRNRKNVKSADKIFRKQTLESLTP